MTNLNKGESATQTKNKADDPKEKKEQQSERLNEQQVDEIINNVPEVKDKINKEADRIARRLTLEDRFKQYDDNHLQSGLKAYKELDTQNYEQIVKLRTEIISNPKKYSDSELEEASNKIETAFEVDRNIHKHREMYRKQQSESKPILEDSSNPDVMVPHREFPISEKYSLRDVYDDTCKEATTVWANEAAEFRRRRPSVEQIVKSHIV